MLRSLDDYLHAKNLRNCWISSRDIDDQRILQSDWKRGAKLYLASSGHTQPNVVASEATFL